MERTDSPSESKGRAGKKTFKVPAWVKSVASLEGASIIIALCSLFLTIDQACLARNQQRLSVRPAIHLDFQFKEGSDAGIILSNRGLGPARIKSLTLTLDGKPQGSWTAVLRAINALPASGTVTFGRIPNDTVYPVGYEELLIKTDGASSASAFRKAFDRMRIEACYCSLYNECWLFALPDYSTTPQPNGCPIGPQPIND